MQAWVCQGGGAKGSFQAGAMAYVAEKEGLPELIVGNSAGALNAAAFGFVGPEKAKDIWFGMDGIRSVWSPPLSLHVPNGLFNSKALRKLIDAGTEGDPQTEVIVSCTDLNSGETLYETSNCADRNWFRTMCEASAALPGIIEPIADHLSDGGIRENCPLKPLAPHS